MDFYIGEIRMFAFNFAPQGWAFCQGQTLSISQNTALFSLIGTFYGGNGTSTFQLPDLRSRVPVNMGQGAGLNPYVLGQTSGAQQVTLQVGNLAPHSHTVNASDTTGIRINPANKIMASVSSNPIYSENPATNIVSMNPMMISPTGSGTPFSILPPSLAINFCISLQGIFPSRN